MEFSFFAKASEENVVKNSVFLIMDNDSGYISQKDCDTNADNPEICNEMVGNKPVFLSEDALLERPDINIKDLDISAEIDKEDYEETRKLFFNSPSSTVEASFESQKTEFSGFETDISDASVVVPIASQICYKTNENSDGSFMSVDCDASLSDNNLSSAPNSTMWSYLDMDTGETSTYNDKNVKIAPKDSQFSSRTEKVLSNVTNICDSSNRGNNDKVVAPYGDCDSNKENIFYDRATSNTPKKILKNTVNPDLSPDLFAEHDNVAVNAVQVDKIAEEQYVDKRDHKLIKRVLNGLSGVPPPPSVTVVQLTTTELLDKIESNKDFFWWSDSPASDHKDKSESDETKAVNKSGQNASLNGSNDSGMLSLSKSLLVTEALEESLQKKFPHIMKARNHGLHHNRSKLSEEFEHLCDKYASRYVGLETQSSCTVFETKFSSPSKRKNIKPRWCAKSPGRRLSHLARRRITFSSANLPSSSLSAGLRARQILVDCKKLELLNRKRSPRKSPKKTPSKSPMKGRTPSSSAKKKLRMRFRLLSGDFKDNQPASSAASKLAGSKRALFQSPDRDKNSSLFLPGTSGLSSSFGTDLRAPNSVKQKLFGSPIKKASPFKNSMFEKKRKRSESDEADSTSKLTRSISMEGKSSTSNTSVNFHRSQSETLSKSNDLSVAHKKKLQWAVYEALKLQNILPNHPQFKVFASVLARVTRKFILSSGVTKAEGSSTSERMLRVARHHSFAVVKGKSVEEIIAEHLRNKAKLQKPQGYVPIEEFREQQRLTMSTNKENVLQDRANTIESIEKRKLEALGGVKLKENNRIDRIRKVINFEEDNR